VTTTSHRTLLLGRVASAWAARLADRLGPLHGLYPEWRAETITTALKQLDSDVPDLVVVLQDTPDQFPSRDIRQLLSTWPLARLVVCYGPWCRGDGRNRDNWPLAVRVPHTSAANRLAAECRVLGGVETGLPWTASRDEIAASEYRTRHHPEQTAFRFHIISPDSTWAHTLADQLSCVGGVSGPLPAADLLLVDIDPWEESRFSEWGADLGGGSFQVAVLLTNIPDNLPGPPFDPMTAPFRIVVRDKLAAAARPGELVRLLDVSRARRSA